MFSLYKKELRSYYCSPFAYIIAALFLLVFSLSFINGISNLSGISLVDYYLVDILQHFFSKRSLWLIVVAVRDRKSTRLNSSHPTTSRMPSSA